MVKFIVSQLSELLNHPTVAVQGQFREVGELVRQRMGSGPHGRLRVTSGEGLKDPTFVGPQPFNE